MSRKQMPWLGVTETAKLARADLKARGIKARVRSRKFANGSSIDVYLTLKEFEKMSPLGWAEWAKKWRYGTFDAMTDSYDHDADHYINHPELGRCRGGAKYVTINKEG